MEAKLTAERREGTGKGVARKLRAAGRVPGILYGHGMEPIALAVDARELYHVLHTGAGTNVLVGLKVDGDEHLALPREIQRDHVKGGLVHVDFLAIRRDETITVDVPVRIVGESVGVKAGGVVEHRLWDLHVECLPMDVPDAIEADVTNLEIGDALFVRDIPVPDGVAVLTDPEEQVVQVVTPQVLQVEPELEEAEAALEGEEVPEGEEAEAPAAEEGGEAAEGGSEESGE